MIKCICSVYRSTLEKGLGIMAFRRSNRITSQIAVRKAKVKIGDNEFIPAVHRDRKGNHVAHVHKLGSNGRRAQCVAIVVVDPQGRKVVRKDH